MTTRAPDERIRDAAALEGDAVEHCDAVVVGSGAGGAVLAKELAEGGMQVVVLEEGGAQHERRGLAFEALGRLYRDTSLTATLGRPFIPIPLGKCWGGTTHINSGTCFRTPDAIIDLWRNKFGLHQIDHETMNRAFERVEAELGVAQADFAVMSRANTLTHELLKKEGFQSGAMRRNAPTCEGCGMCCYGCTSYAKRSMELSYLPKALEAGAKAYTHACATRILRDRQGAAAGIVARAVDDLSRPTGPRLTVKAPIVVAACGTLLTPPFLKINRIARGNRHLGRHLTIHPATKVYADFEEDINGWNGIPQACYSQVLHDDGIMFEGAFLPPDLGVLGIPFSGKPLVDFIERFRHMAAFGFMVNDTSEGRLIRIPAVGYRYSYSLSKTDLERIRRAIAFLARLFLRNGARAVYPLVTARDNVFTRLEEVDRFEARPLRAMDTEILAFHPLGTCRMAPSPDLGVCDPCHQVYGTPGLYVCDGSVVPSALGVNPQITIMALATRLADLLLGNGKSPAGEEDAC